MTNDALKALDKIQSDVDGLFPKHTHGERFETIRAALAKNGCCDIDPDRCAGMCEDAVKALAALAPVDVEGLKKPVNDGVFIRCAQNFNMGYNQAIDDLAARGCFGMPAKSCSDCPEWIGQKTCCGLKDKAAQKKEG